VPLAAGGAAVLIVEQRARAVLASPDFVESFLGGGRGQAAAPRAEP
jgi:hypothetical protein